jgi:hypothetical protein
VLLAHPVQPAPLGEEKDCIGERLACRETPDFEEVWAMIKKVAAVIAFAAGAYFAYEYLPDFLSQYSTDPDYWKYMGGDEIRTFGQQVLHIGLSAGSGLVCGVVVYFLLNLYARPE